MGGRDCQCVHIKKRKYKIVKLLLSPAWAEPRLVISRKAKYKYSEEVRGEGGGCWGCERAMGKLRFNA